MGPGGDFSVVPPVPRRRLLSLAAAIPLGTPLAPASPLRRQTGKAPELEGGPWLNSVPLTLDARQGLVTVVHFWTYGCYNCKNNLDVYARWHDSFRDRNVALIGIHTPEFDHEAVTANVEREVRLLKIAWPVLVDSRRANWRRWRQEFWPAIYLVDRGGELRYRWDGELNYRNSGGEAMMASAIAGLLSER